LQVKPAAQQQSALDAVVTKGGAAQLNEPVPDREDSSWSVNGTLSHGANRAGTDAYDSGGTALIKRLIDQGLSNREIKQMIPGSYTVFSAYGTTLKLTELGRKIAVIHGGKPKTPEIQK